ncbi:ribonuclease H-like domain-containing protein [Tanacetum coccineum]|uniref:Ribonuclease H-like domain-containing protein n=1 Tax=Tanacetum coccineum TaxID=301880 RepID=A0ABQ5CY54_9ASTR
MGFIVYQMDVKSAFLYGKIDEEVYVVSTSGFGRSLKYHKKDLQSSESSLCVYTKLPEPNEFYGRALFISLITGQTESGSILIGSLMYLTASRPDIMFAQFVLCSRFQVTPKTSHLSAVKRIFRYLKGKPKLGLWYPRVSSFDLEAYSDSDYAGANLDRKSTTRGCQFLGRRLISWQCKKQTIMATSTTEA